MSNYFKQLPDFEYVSRLPDAKISDYITVKNLFFNVPARRNFLKSDKVEFRHVIDEFHRIALSHPEVKFILFQNGTELFSLVESNFKKRIGNIFGISFITWFKLNPKSRHANAAIPKFIA